VSGPLPGPRPALDDAAALFRLDVFMRAHPKVNVVQPPSPWARWRAELEPGTVPGDDRGMTVTDRDLGKFVGKLENLFAPP